jgi:hypothetical protein
VISGTVLPYTFLQTSGTPLTGTLFVKLLLSNKQFRLALQRQWADEEESPQLPESRKLPVVSSNGEMKFFLHKNAWSLVPFQASVKESQLACRC